MNLLNQFKKTLLENAQAPSNATVKNYVADIKKFITWFEHTFQRPFPPPALPHGLVESYLKLFEASSPRSAKRYQSSLKKFFSYLQTEGHLSYNPLIQAVRSQSNLDPWHLKEFGSFLYNSKASSLTTKNYLLDVKQFLNWAKQVGTEGDVFANIDSFMLEEYKKRLLNEARLSPVSINRKLSSLRKYLNWAVNGNLIKNKALEIPNIQKIEAIESIPTSPISTDLGMSNEDLDEITKLQPEISKDADSPEKGQDTGNRSYSRFPPLRLLQKTKWALGALLDALVILSIIKSFEAIKYNLWKATSKEIFASLPSIIRSVNPGTISLPEIRVNNHNSVVDQFITSSNSAVARASIKSIPKSIYAPLKISTDSLPYWEKIIHQIKHIRPRWYKIYHNYSFVHYVHFAIVLIFTIYAGFTIYDVLKNPPIQKNVLAEKVTPSRLISFHGNLNDANGAPITKDSLLKFAIYSDDTASSARVWEERQKITPEPDGSFTAILGKNSPISQEIFIDNPSLYLGISIGTDPELKPRQELASVKLTKDSQALQGLKPITGNNANTSNVILALDSSGNLTIGGTATPVFQATGGEFRLSGQQLTLATNPDSNSNVQIVPDGTGIIDLQKPLQNTSNNNNLDSALGAVEVDDNFAILASSSAQSALIINQNSDGGLISAASGGIAKFTVDKGGSATFGGDITVLGNNLTTSTNTFNIANQTTTNLNIGGAATSVLIGASTGTTSINNNLKVAGKLSLSGFVTGAIPFINSDNQLTHDSANFIWDNANKRLGLGTATPLFRLDVQDSLNSGPVAQVQNLSAGSDADGLVVKLGFTGTGTQPTALNSFAGNRFLTFTNGAGSIQGAIESNGLNGINYKTTGADFAEYFQKSDSEETISAGDLVCFKSNGVGKCDSLSRNMLGVVSANPGFTGGQDGPGKIIVGLLGQVPVKIATNSEAIKIGDMLTSSGNPGKASKATTAGQIIGRALENFDPKSGQNNIIRIALSVSWYDPMLSLTANGDLASPTTQNTSIISGGELDSLEKAVESVQTFADTLSIGVLELQKVSVKSLSVATEDITIGAQTLREYILAIVNEEIDKRLAQEGENKITIVSPISTTITDASSSGELANPQIATPSLAPSPYPPSPSPSIVNITNIYNNISNTQPATQSATTASNSAIPTPTAASLTPTPEEVTPTPSTSPTPAVLPTPVPEDSANEPKPKLITVEETMKRLFASQNTDTESMDVASLAAELTYTPNLKSDFGKFEYGLIALGPTSLAETSINGQLTIGSNMTISENSINSIGADLDLQPLRQGNFKVMGGLFTLDTEGNMQVSGNATFAKDVNIKGTLAAGIISPLAESDLVVKLGKSNQESGSTNQGKNHDSSFIIHDSSGKEVVKIDQSGAITSSGSAIFSGIKLVRGAQADTSPTQTTAGGSAGTATITANQTERTIITPFVTEDSLIYITPVTPTLGATPYIARQTIENITINSRGSFTIQIATPLSSDIKLNWWIIN